MRLSLCYSLLSSIVFLLGANSSYATTNSDTAVTPVQTSAGLTSKAFNNFIEKYQNAIEEIELQEGVYGGKLAQELQNLGTLYQNHGDHSGAIKVLNRSLHISRINEGLYSPSQIPILEKIIHSHKELEQWQLVSERYNYQYWLYSTNFGDDDIEMIEMELKLAYWYLNAYNLKIAPGPAQNLLNSYSLFKKLVQVMSSKYGEKDIRLIEALNGMMIANYFIATHVQSYRTEFEPANNQVLVTKSTSNISYLQRKSFSAGKEIIDKEHSVLSEQHAVNHLFVTKNIVKQADWHLLYGKFNQAKALYQQAYNYARSNDVDNESVKQLFNTPVALPDLPHLNNKFKTKPSDPAQAATEKYVHASFKVSPFGKVKNVKIVGSNPPDASGMRAKVIRSLRASKFRPKFENGVPVLTEQTEIRVVVN